MEKIAELHEPYKIREARKHVGRSVEDGRDEVDSAGAGADELAELSRYSFRPGLTLFEHSRMSGGEPNNLTNR